MYHVYQCINIQNYLTILSIIYHFDQDCTTPPNHALASPPTLGSDVTLRENWSVFIRCRTMPLGAALAV